MVSKVLNQTTNFVVIADKEKFQHVAVLTEQQAQFQPRATFKYILFQSPDGNAAMSMGTAKTIGNELKRRFDPADIHLVQVLERGLEPRAKQNVGSRHALVFP